MSPVFIQTCCPVWCWPEPTGRSKKGHEDGILTALEVSELDLSKVELATLSACETGLGQTAGGEGLLGLQRAFQLAGAKTTMASLWQVPDRATQALMSRFYENLGDGECRSWRPARGSTLADPRRPKQPELLGRGLTFTAPTVKDQPQVPARLSPFYWAAFELSGDLRVGFPAGAAYQVLCQRLILGLCATGSASDLWNSCLDRSATKNTGRASGTLNSSCDNALAVRRHAAR